MTANGRGELAVVAARSVDQADGIRDYTEQLIVGLRTHTDIPVMQYAREPHPWTLRISGKRSPECATGEHRVGLAETVVLQYNPFSHGRRGFAPGLALAMLLLRCRRPRPMIALMVHETFVDANNWRWLLMRTWQRLQLRVLQGAADVVFCTIERWTDDMRRSWPPAPVHQLPVASNLPDRRDDRAAGRALLGASDDAVVLCTFGIDHAGRLTGYMIDAAAAVAREGRPVVLLSLGTGQRRREQIAPGVTLDVPGFLPKTEAAVLLAAADLFLAPFADGVSMRRTSVMAALQHEIAVVGTDGHLTDDSLRRATRAMRLVPVGDHDAFVTTVGALALDDEERGAMAVIGRRLYEAAFDWPVLVEGLLSVVDAARSQR